MKIIIHSFISQQMIAVVNLNFSLFNHGLITYNSQILKLDVYYRPVFVSVSILNTLVQCKVNNAVKFSIVTMTLYHTMDIT